jgi:predicted transcriptional regulator
MEPPRHQRTKAQQMLNMDKQWWLYSEAMPKTMTLRLSDELAADLEAMARVDDVPVSEAIRIAIDERIKGRRDDKQFQARLRRLMAENQRALERLAQ